MDALITIANVLFILGHFMKDLLRLRVLSFAGTVMLACYFALRPEPLVQVVCWNLLFASLNAWWIWRLAWERRAGRNAGGR